MKKHQNSFNQHSSNIPCLICGNLSKLAGKAICQNCFAQYLDRNSWTGCARCGKLECVACETLSEFSGVDSLYRLDSCSAHLLVQAKDHNDLESRWVLEDLCAMHFRIRAHETVKKFSVSHIVISPLRQERVSNSSWHPGLILERSCRSLNVRVVSSTIAGIARQASLRARERIVHIPNAHLVFPNLSKLQKETVTAVLFVDDVLTTGGSALRTKNIFPQNFSEAPWHALTFFRSPQHEQIKI